MFGFRRQEAQEERWDAFEAEALPHLPDLYRTARWLTRDHHRAEDLVQEVMFQSLRSFHLYNKGTNCKAWLMRILFNHNATRLRRERRLALVDDPDHEILGTVAFEPPIPQHLSDEQMIDALWELPESYRETVVLIDVEEFSYKEVSAIMGVPLGTVMSRIARARKLLRQSLGSLRNQPAQRRTAHQ